jgi:ankyrin repeat protein
VKSNILYVALFIIVVMALMLFSRREIGISHIASLRTMIQSGDLEGVSRLIREHPQLLEADLGGHRGENFRALQFAAGLNRDEICRALLTAGANVNATDFAHLTALHEAVQNCNTGLIVTLLDHGADITIKDSMRRTPLDFAREIKAPDAVVEILMSAMVKATNH